MKKKLAGWLGMLGAMTAMSGTARAEQWGEMPKLQEFLGLPMQELEINARSMEAKGLQRAELSKETRPWSDTFWPDTTGSIADPYNETHIARKGSYATWALTFGNANVAWKTSRRFVADREELYKKLRTAPQSVKQEDIDNMSPAEKHDLLMGDLTFTLQRRVIYMIDTRSTKDVDLLALWSGVCHGWSAAALTLDRPQHTFQLMSPIGRMITFYPADVKALSSFLWGKSLAQQSTKVEGWQCQSGAKTDKYGRLVDPRCADVNPGFMHIAMVNQIGKKRKGFVMDRTYRAQVMNQPVWAYKFSYFKVTDRQPEAGKTLDKALVSIASLKFDPFRHYRSKKAKYIVGVEATLAYSDEAQPDHKATNGIEDDKNKKYETRYDLELDENMNIVGGEWREFNAAEAPTLVEQFDYKHPDLIWLVPDGVKAWSIADADITTAWDGTTPAPADWRKAAIKAAYYMPDETIKGKVVHMPAPQPLGKVVDILVKMSRGK